ncbi:MAG: amino acid adenylation domain-containing protein, partial [Anaerolineales bacterium]
APISQVLFNYERFSQSLPQAAGAETSEEVKGWSEEPLDLTIEIVETDDALSCMFRFNDDLIDARAVRHLHNQYLFILQQIARNPNSSLDSYSLVTDSSQDLLPDPREPIPEPSFHPIPELIALWANRTPAATAVEMGGKSWTYRELTESASELARLLLEQGLSKEDVVAVQGKRSFGLISSMIGVLMAGGVLLMLDPNLPLERQSIMLREAGTTFMVTTENRTVQVETDIPWIQIDSQTGKPRSGERQQQLELPELKGDDPAYIFFTSGTTGVPKGILGDHKGMAHFLNWQREQFEITSEDRGSQLINTGFDAILRDTFLPLTSGATLVLPHEEEEIEPARLIQWLREKRISFLHTVPSLAQIWLREAERMSPEETLLDDLRWVFLSGEPLNEGLVNRWRVVFGKSGQLLNFYGPTETTMIKTCFLVPDEPFAGVQPAGEPLPNTQTLVLANGRLCGIGELGEIVIRTPFRTRGYINAPEEQRRFVRNPFREDEKDLLFFTGDAGRYRPDGSLEILGRMDDQIKIRGVRIEPAEIEAVLEQHPAVHKAAIVVHEGEQGKFLAAYIVPVDEMDSGELRRFAIEKLLAVMVPSHFVELKEMPLSANGKVNRKALSAIELGEVELAEEYVAPRTATEEALVEIWKEVLRLDLVGIYDDFFALGGHSLLAMQAIGRMRKAFQTEISVSEFFDEPTVFGLASYLANDKVIHRVQNISPITPITDDAERQLSYAQQRMWFIDQLEPGKATYNILIALRLEGALDLTTMEQSLEEIVRRHESLRTTFPSVEGKPFQVISAPEPFMLPLNDLSELPEAKREMEARRLAAEEAQRPFDLARGPLLRAVLYRLSGKEHILLLTFHHIVTDGWSTGVFSHELAVLYEAFSTGKPSPLAELSIQYADFALWQRQHLQSEALEPLLSYWKQQLSDAPPLLELPTDRPRPAVQSNKGRTQSFLLPLSLSEKLSRLGQQEGATLFMTLLAAYQTLLYRYSGQEDILVGTPVANRTHPEIERLIGFFVNTLVLRTDLSGDPTFRELLNRIRQVA